MTCKEIIDRIKSLESDRYREGQARFGIKGVDNYGLSQPQIKAIAKEAGKNNHTLAMELWETGIHEAKHIAVLIADKKQADEKLIEKWIKDFNSWDIVDNTCSNLICRLPFAYEKAIEWTTREKEFEKRAAFALMAYLAVHDKKAPDEKFRQFYPYLFKESSDERNFVKKAVNWAIRQIGKRNGVLRKEMIKLSEEIYAKGDKASKWIAKDALRELED